MHDDDGGDQGDVDDDEAHLVLSCELDHLRILWLAAEDASHPHLKRIKDPLKRSRLFQWYFLIVS